MPNQVRFGQTVWAVIADDNGIMKERPAVVVTPNDQIAAFGLIDVVAVTSTLQDPLPEDHVLLPWHRQGHPRTGLNRKSAAVCSWVVQIPVDEVHNIVGSVSGTVLAEILRKISPKPP